MNLHRRGFLGAAAATVAGAAVAGFTTAEKQPAGQASASPSGIIPFHGQHQAGILTDRQAAAAFVAFDVTAANRSELTDLLHTLTDRARLLTTGGTPPEIGISAPPSDSGLLGLPIPAGGLTVTVGVGASLFDDRFGLAAQRRSGCARWTRFANDDLDPARCDGDLLLQICADNRDTVLHALRDLTRHTRGGMQPRWRVDGFAGPAASDRRAAQPPRLQGRHRQSRRARRDGDGPARLGAAGGRRAGLGSGRQLSGGPGDPDAGRVLGPGDASPSRRR